MADASSDTSGGAGGYFSAAATVLGDVSSYESAAASVKVLKENATDARTNATLSQNSLDLKVAQQQRKSSQVLGGQRADIAGAGLANSGSALDVMRSSAISASMDTALIHMQGQIDVNKYLSQSRQLDEQVKAAEKKANGAAFGAVLSVVGGVVGAIYGGPAGASAGASAGSSAGEAIGGA